MEEIWEDIINFEDSYQVSSLGRIRSKTRKINCANGATRTIKGKIINPQKQNSGYLTVGLWKNNICHTTLIHRLVAQAFIPNPDSLPDVNHKDGNKHNNELSNLEWCTKTENMLHAVRTGIMDNQRKIVGQNNIKIKSKPVLQFSLDGKFIQEFSSVNEVCRLFGYKQGAISNVCRGERNRAYGFKWRYK